LFDEIDELVREREQENDAFGRFLTTSMLPKLAELWKRQKIIYFVATNHIEFFDPAIIRAQRFDALIHVPPPSFTKKLSRLADLLKRSIRVTGVRFKRRDVDKAVEGAAKLCKGKKFVSLPKELSLARFLLIRWDQLDELAAAIAEQSRGKQKIVLTRQLMENALASCSDRLLGSCKSYKDFLNSAAYEQHDFRKIAVWKVKGSVPQKWKSELLTHKGQYFYKSNARFGDFTGFPSGSVAISPDTLRFRK
jgi:SpoVK/Ycf46/Vps4 family AAA+-type ATPase